MHLHDHSGKSCQRLICRAKRAVHYCCLLVAWLGEKVRQSRVLLIDRELETRTPRNLHI